MRGRVPAPGEAPGRPAGPGEPPKLAAFDWPRATFPFPVLVGLSSPFGRRSARPKLQPIRRADGPGFVEAEGSFYLVSKEQTRIVHGFSLIQKLDKIVLDSIKYILHIPTIVKYKSKHNYYILNTTNSRAIENIIKYFHNTMKGMKSVEYRI